MERKTRKIKRIFKEVFRVSQYELAAEKLIEAGFSSQDLWEFEKTTEGKYLPSDQTCNTMNEMRNIEITGKMSNKNIK